MIMLKTRLAMMDRMTGSDIEEEENDYIMKMILIKSLGGL